MKTSLLFLVAIVTSLLAGCATSYQDKSFSGGFTDTQLDENVWQVNFNGNGYTSMERVRDFALLRSAEIALTNGYTYFAVMDENASEKNSTYKTPSTTNAYATCMGGSCSGSATTNGGQTYNVKKHGNSRVVVMLNEKPEQGFVYNARMVFSSMVDKYELQEEVNPALL